MMIQQQLPPPQLLPQHMFFTSLSVRRAGGERSRSLRAPSASSYVGMGEVDTAEFICPSQGVELLARG